MVANVVAAETLDDFVRRFHTCALTKPEWTHAAHLRVGAWHVHHQGESQALETLRTGIRRLNESHGVANTESGGYHETITAAYVRVIATFLAMSAATDTLEARVTTLVEGPLGARELLFRFWTKERLLSSGARAAWVDPDVQPINRPNVLHAMSLDPRQRQA